MTSPLTSKTQPRGMLPKAPRRGRTSNERENEPEPRLPHERDESTDSQKQAEPAQAEKGRQAQQDVSRGLVDTDRGPVMDQLYKRTLKPPGPGTPGKGGKGGKGA